MPGLFILVAGRSEPLRYPPPPGVRYGELSRLLRAAKAGGFTVEGADLQHRLSTFFEAGDVPVDRGSAAHGVQLGLFA